MHIFSSNDGWDGAGNGARAMVVVCVRAREHMCARMCVWGGYFANLS